MTEIRAAVLVDGQQELALQALSIEEPREGEVLVRVVATGICHTDMVLRDAGITGRPVVLGHEGAGVVERLGAGVTGFAVGDRVAISFAHCGACKHCEQDKPSYCELFFPLNYVAGRGDGSHSLSLDGQPVGSHIFGQSSFASYSVCPASNLVKVPEGFPLELAGPFGCGFQTGAGTVLNALQVPNGASIAVLGAGAVGLAAVAAAANIAGAGTVIAVDIHPERLQVATEVGATHTLDGRASDLDEQVRTICPGGVEFVIDTTARTAFVERWLPLMSLRGTLALVASYPQEDSFSFNAVTMMISGKRIIGVMEGDTDVQTFIPALMRHHIEGRFPMDKLVRYYDFADFNQAIHDAESGKTIKAVVRMPHPASE